MSGSVSQCAVRADQSGGRPCLGCTGSPGSSLSAWHNDRGTQTPGMGSRGKVCVWGASRRACVRACMCVCVRACVHVCVRACGYGLGSPYTL